MFGKITRQAREGKSSNPLIRSIQRDATRAEQLDTLEAGLSPIELETAGRMSVAGAVNKTFLLTFLMLITAAFAFSNPSSTLMWVGAGGGLVMVLVASFKPNTANWSAPAYALFEGLFVGAITAFYAYAYNGIVFQAVSLTIAILLSMLALYQTGVIKVTAKFRAGVMMATAAVLVVYLASFALSFFGINLPFLHEGGLMGIGISCVILAIASMNLLLDFDNFEQGAAQGLSRKYEWVFAMGLLVTLVWIYVELLRLLAIMSSDD